MGVSKELREEIYRYFEGDMNGSAPDSIRMLERSPRAAPRDQIKGMSAPPSGLHR